MVSKECNGTNTMLNGSDCGFPGCLDVALVTAVLLLCFTWRGLMAAVFVTVSLMALMWSPCIAVFLPGR
ncbi:hypothetical protein DFJ77DRAFT_263454 [Powellomyces hirtus]|nr:hypothetical protein DFJ77DRAFT_263454 [Powellomyces hirtus]